MVLSKARSGATIQCRGKTWQVQGVAEASTDQITARLCLPLTRLPETSCTRFVRRLLNLPCPCPSLPDGSDHPPPFGFPAGGRCRGFDQPNDSERGGEHTRKRWILDAHDGEIFECALARPRARGSLGDSSTADKADGKAWRG